MKNIDKASILMFLLVDQQLTNINYFESIHYSQLSDLIFEKEEVVIYFYKNNCQPCSVQKDLINEIINEYNYEIYGVNIETYDGQSYGIVEEYDMKYTPTFIKYKMGNVLTGKTV